MQAQPSKQVEVQASVTVAFLLDEEGRTLIQTEGDLDRPLLFLAAIEALAQAVQDWFVSPPLLAN